MSVLFVDGWFGPDPGDWQEHWADSLPDAARLEQDDWERPERHAWVARLDKTIADCSRPPVLVAHSLGCLTVAHWVAAGGSRPVRAALLVAPADVERNSEAEIRGFAPIPRSALPFPSLLVASGNDRWMTPERARFFADAWGSGFAGAGDVGHLTVDGGYGPWPWGRRLLDDFLASTQVPAGGPSGSQNEPRDASSVVRRTSDHR